MIGSDSGDLVLFVAVAAAADALLLLFVDAVS